MILNKSYYLCLTFLTSYVIVRTKGRSCVFDYSRSNEIFKSCGYCGVCKKLDNKSSSGTCDDQYLTRSGLFTNFHSNGECELKNHCNSNNGILCQDVNRSTGLCYPLYGTYKCQCKEGFFGKNCENEIDLKTTIGRRKKFQLYADVNNVVFTPIFYSTKPAAVLISFRRKGLSLKIYVDNGREQLIYNEKKCEQQLETLNKFCSDLFRRNNKTKLCSGITPQEEALQLKNKGCLISLKILYPPSYDRNRVINKHVNQSSSKHIMANLETISVAVYNHFGISVNKPVLRYTFDLINIHKTSDLKSKCSLRIKLVNCGKTMQSMPKISAYSDMAIVWSLKILTFDLSCLKYGKVRTTWEVWRLEENHDELEDKPLLKMYERKEYLVKETPLNFGVYKVKLTLAVTFSDYILREKAYCYFEVVRFSIQITLLGGSLRTVNSKKPIKFRILQSNIPDRYDPDDYTDTVFTWRCDHSQDKVCKPFKTSNTVRRVEGPFLGSGNYKFTLDAKTVDNSGFEIEQHQETQVIKFSSSPVTSLAIKCLRNCGGSIFKSNPQEIIHLKLAHEELFPNSEFFKYDWKYKRLDNAQDQLQGVDEIRMEDNTDNSELVVDYNKLSENSKYLFVVSLEDSSGSAEIIIETDQSPSSITCEAKPKSGIRGETFFSISCKDHNKKNTFPSLTFEFYNRHANEVVGRMLGYSMTGDISRIILTRDKLFVCVTNFFGTSSEIEILVKLNPPALPESSSSVRERRNVYIGNYIDQLGLLSSHSDSAPSPLFWVDSTAAYLRSLLKEPVDDLMGAIFLQKTLHQIACEKLVESAENKFKCKTILSVASIMLHATKTIRDSLSCSNMNPRIVNTVRTKNFVTSVLECSSVVLELSFLNQNKSNEINVHDCLKTSTFHTIETLNSLVHIIAHQIFPSIKQWYESKSVHMFVQKVTPGYLQDLNKKTLLKEGFIDILEKNQYYTQVIIFEKNPFWWGSGYKINTNVFSVNLYKGDEPVDNAESEQRLEYILSVNNFHPTLASGFVTQPDPIKGPEVTDFKIAIYRIIPEGYSKTFVKFIDLGKNETLRVIISKNIRPDFDLMNAKAENVTESSTELSFDTGSIQDDSFYYIGIIPGSDVKVGGIVNYTFVLFSARCAVWKHKVWMSGSKCVVKQDLGVNTEILICSCTLLSLIIGGNVYVPTNSLNPFSNLSLFLKTPDNPVIVLFLLVVFFVFSILLVLTRIKDQKDKKKLNASLLEDSSQENTHAYLVGVFTGSRIGAGTTSNVGFKLFGDKGTSRTHVFTSSKRTILQSGSDDWFLFFTPQNLGTLLKIQLWIDYTGKWPNWYCKMVFVCSMSNYETGTFIVEKWFGVNLKEVCLEKLIKAASVNEVNTFGAILCDNIVYGFRDLHFVVSLFHKHPRTVVCRTERLSVALSSILMTICVSILLYSVSFPTFEDFPVYHVSSEVFVYCILCSAAATAFGLINMSCFRRCYSINRNTHHSHVHGAFEKQCSTKKTSKKEFKAVIELSNYFFELFYKYVDKYINTCYLIPVTNCKSLTVINVDVGKTILAWIITVTVIVVSSYIIIVSSFTFGEVKTSVWMTCLLISLIFCVFVLLSLKVVFVSLMCSLRKVRIFDLLAHRIDNTNLSLNIEKDMYDKFHSKFNKNLFFDTYIAKEVQRNKRVAKTHYRTIRIWVASFIIESFILLVILYLIMGEFETFKYFQSSSTVCNEILSKYICEAVYYADTSSYNLKNDVLKLVLPKLFKTKWYNGQELSSNEVLSEETGWLNDITSRLIGDPLLLQVRVEKNMCKVPSVMSVHTKNCFPVLSHSTEDRKNYCLGWTDEDWNAILFPESPWKFTKGVGVGIRTSSGFYFTEGGYVTSLLNTLELARHVTMNLIDTNWMDQQTRVIVLQFLTYNPNNNIFTSSYFVTEVFPTNFIKTTSTVKSIGFYYHKLSFQGIIFIIFTALFFIRLIVTINIMGVNAFFKDLWNGYDVFLFFVYFSTVIEYIQLMHLLAREQEVVESGITDKNVHLETMYQSLDATIRALCFTFVSAAVRFVRITRVNERCREYLSDLVETKTELFWTLVISFVSLYRQFRLIMYFIEPPSVYDVIDILGFTSKYHPYLQKEYYSMSGKIVALVLFKFSEVSLLSFTISLIHHHRQVKLRRISLLVD